MNNRDKIEALKRQLILHPSYLTIIEEIEKDLEILEILKKHIYSSDSSISIILDDLRNYDDFKKVKEWLGNE